MKLYFLRHGKADWPDWQKPDDERPLNEKGHKEIGKVAKWLDALEIKPDCLLSSPLPRAYQTAEIVAETLKLKVITEPLLAPGCSIVKLRNALKKHEGKECMVFGHEPDFSELLRNITGGTIKITKGGCACVEMETEKEGILLWLVTPKIAKIC